MIAAGLLDTRISVYKHTNIQSSIGEVNLTWQKYGTYWSNIRKISARKLIESGRELNENIITAMLRYREDINISDRISYNNSFYNISNIDYNKKEGYIILTCEISE